MTIVVITQTNRLKLIMVSRNLRFQFTLASYNILSQTLLNEHLHLYRNCNPADLEWPRRGQRILTELLDNQADIICLQEVDSEHLQSLYRPRLARHGYECLYKKKTGYKLDGCAIFYKSQMFNLLNHKGVEFNRTDITHLLNRDNVGLIALLEPRDLKRPKASHLVIANTHLLFNPARSDVRHAQLRYFLAQLEEISFDYHDPTRNERCHLPTILCGDLNSTPNSPLSDYILGRRHPSRVYLGYNDDDENDDDNSADQLGTNNDHAHQTRPTADITRSESNSKPKNAASAGVRLEDLDLFSSETEATDNGEAQSKDARQSSNGSGRPPSTRAGARLAGGSEVAGQYQHSFKFKSAYPSQKPNGQLYVSTFKSDIVDHIFYTHTKLRLESYRELLTREQLASIGPLPNSEFPSDHLSLEAKFTLK